jgi:hypothetical protein
VRSELLGLLPKLASNDAGKLRRALARLASDDTSIQEQALRGLLDKPGFSSTPIGRLLVALGERGLLALLDRLSDVRSIAANLLSILDGGVVNFRQPQAGLVLKREMFYMIRTGETDGGGPVMDTLSTKAGDAAESVVFPMGVRGVRFWLERRRATQYDVRYGVLLSNGSKTAGANSEGAGDWTPLRSSTQHQLVWLSLVHRFKVTTDRSFLCDFAR